MLTSASYVDRTVEGDKEGDDWLAPERLPQGQVDPEDFDVVDANDGQEGNEFEALKSESNQAQPTILPSNLSSKISPEDTEYLDMEDESLALDESVAAIDLSDNSNTKDNTIISARRYDVSITYDNYYRTPRIWLFGYKENGTPLTHEEIYQVIQSMHILMNQ